MYKLFAAGPSYKTTKPSLDSTFVYSTKMYYTKYKLIVRGEYYLIRTLIYKNDEMIIYLLISTFFVKFLLSIYALFVGRRNRLSIDV